VAKLIITIICLNLGDQLNLHFRYVFSLLIAFCVFVAISCLSFSFI